MVYIKTKSEFESVMHIACDRQCLSQFKFSWHSFTRSFSWKYKVAQSALNQQLNDDSLLYTQCTVPKSYNSILIAQTSALTILYV